MKNALIIFTRIPIPNKTKTRLMSVLTPKQCALLHESFLYDINDILNPLIYDTYIAHSDEGSPSILDPIFPNYTKFLQEGNTLGERMYNAIETVFNKGYKNVVLIGADTPTIKSKDLQDAFEHLNNQNLVLGLTNDGGYYLVGMDNLYSYFFDNSITWGTEQVASQSLETLKNHNLKLAYVSTYNDIDVEEDLKSLRVIIDPNTKTAKTLNQIFSSNLEVMR